VDGEYGVQAQISADVDAPDRVFYGLTVRQVAILGATGVLLWAAYRALAPLVPPMVIVIAAVPIAAIAAGLALGRRDGISMDRWVAAAAVAARAPRILVPAGDGDVTGAPSWAPLTRTADTKTKARNNRQCTGTGEANAATTPAKVAALRLPAERIRDDGVVDLGSGRVALTAASTVNFDLRTGAEQQALVDGLGRWLNSLSVPTQIVVSSRPIDMHAHADLVEANVDYLPHPALADAAAGYADFLRWLGDDRDPLHRHVVIAHRVGAHAEPAVARRHAEQTARALTGLGAATRVLDGGLITDVLVAACDPWHTTGSGRATPSAVVTADLGGGVR
jgi:hypothetical protein